MAHGTVHNFFGVVALFFTISVTDYQLGFQAQQSLHGVDLLCSVGDLGSTNFSHLDSLFIFKSVAGQLEVIASLSSHYGPNDPVSHLEGAQVTGHLSNEDTVGSYLRITWDHYQDDVDGDYICRLNGVDEDFIPLSLTEELSFKINTMCPCFGTTPQVLRVGLTEELEATCYIPDLTAINISQLASLEIIMIRNGMKQILAEINSVTGTAVKDGPGVGFVNGSLGGRNTFLRLVLENPTAEMASEYICEGSGVGVSGDPVFFSRSVNVSLEVPDSEELIQRLFELYVVQRELKRCQKERDRLTNTTSIMSSPTTTLTTPVTTSPTTTLTTPATTAPTTTITTPVTTAPTTTITTPVTTSPTTTLTTPVTTSPTTTLTTPVTTSPTTTITTPVTTAPTTTITTPVTTSPKTTLTTPATTAPTTTLTTPATTAPTTTLTTPVTTAPTTTLTTPVTTAPTTTLTTPVTTSPTTTLTTQTTTPTTTFSLTTKKSMFPRSCEDANLPVGQHVITIQPDDGLGTMDVLCEVVTPQEIWTLFQKRFNGSVNFYRTFNEYKNGFGSVHGEFWLGLDNTRRLLLQNNDNNQVKFDLIEASTLTPYTKTYPVFSIGRGNDYILNISGGGINREYYGISSCVGQTFSTHDHGYTTVAGSGNRAAGWWFPSWGGYVNINGIWDSRGSQSETMYWYEFRMSWSYPMEKNGNEISKK